MRQILGWINNHLRVVVVVCFALSAIACMMAWLRPGEPAAAASESQLEQPSELLTDVEQPSAPRPTNTAQAASTVIVYISGAVGAPDVYELPSDARIKDLVLAAGGLTTDADREHINLAERLKDSEHIHVPRQGEAQDDGAAVDDTAGATQTGVLDLNTASASDLDSLPGIGQSFAERIIEYRTTNGPFTSVEDLQKVKGIGAALFAKIAPLVSVGP